LEQGPTFSILDTIDRNMNARLFAVIAAIATALFLLLLVTQVAKEGFQSAGTLVQLETSHVPTREEIRDRQHWLRQRVRQDLLDMTGSP
jgi:hypothetical protein